MHHAAPRGSTMQPQGIPPSLQDMWLKVTQNGVANAVSAYQIHAEMRSGNSSLHPTSAVSGSPTHKVTDDLAEQVRVSFLEPAPPTGTICHASCGTDERMGRHVLGAALPSSDLALSSAWQSADVLTWGRPGSRTDLNAP